MSKGEYDDYGRGYDAGREAAADETAKLRAALEAIIELAKEVSPRSTLAIENLARAALS